MFLKIVRGTPNHTSRQPVWTPTRYRRRVPEGSPSCPVTRSSPLHGPSGEAVLSLFPPTRHVAHWHPEGPVVHPGPPFHPVNHVPRLEPDPRQPRQLNTQPNRPRYKYFLPRPRQGQLSKTPRVVTTRILPSWVPGEVTHGPQGSTGVDRFGGCLEGLSVQTPEAGRSGVRHNHPSPFPGRGVRRRRPLSPVFTKRPSQTPVHDSRTPSRLPVWDERGPYTGPFGRRPRGVPGFRSRSLRVPLRRAMSRRKPNWEAEPGNKSSRE